MNEKSRMIRKMGQNLNFFELKLLVLGDSMASIGALWNFG
jgi:hypothetical protein